MSRFKFIFLMLLWTPMTIWANTKQMCQRVKMCVQYDKSSGTSQSPSRLPQAPISFIQDGHILIFEEKYESEIVAVKEENFVLYANIIRQQGRFEIPSTINGTVEIQLMLGERTYRATIEL